MDYKKQIETCIAVVEEIGPSDMKNVADCQFRLANLHAKLLLAERLEQICDKLDDVCGTISVIKV